MKNFLKGLVFWLLSLTWGIVMTTVGLVIALALMITGHKPKRFHHYIWFEVKSIGGGCSLGGVILTGPTPYLSTLRHEAGHGIQNIIFGPIHVFISIHSFIRCMYYNKHIKNNTAYKLKPYDSIWFEGQATKLGNKYFPKFTGSTLGGTA